MAFRWSLYFTVYLYRFLARIFFFFDQTFTKPIPPQQEFETTITTVSRPVPGTIDLLFYTPPSYTSSSDTRKYAVVINFHGGGYTIGRADNDARWAACVTRQLNAVVVSVEYALAPEYPFPTAVGDCADAVRFLWTHADQYRLDVSRTVLTGFSAGGTLLLATAFKLHQDGNTGSLMTKNESIHAGKLVGIVAFYPGLDWTQSREERNASNPVATVKGSISSGLFDMFDNSYLGPPGQRPDRASPYLSPGRADVSLLRDALPQKIALYACEWDQLMMETQHFRERLKALGKDVGGYLVRDAPHGFDKRIRAEGESEKRDEMYADAVGIIEGMLAS